MSKQRIQDTATEIHNQLRRYFEAWQDLKKIADNAGLTIDEKTAEVKNK